MELLVNARHLTGQHTGIEVYMEALLGALARTGRLRITALTWAPIGLDLPGVREVVTARRPDLAPGSVQATLWKLWFDQWGCLRSVPRGEDHHAEAEDRQCLGREVDDPGVVLPE